VRRLGISTPSARRAMLLPEPFIIVSAATESRWNSSGPV
jgi:hypothetical protein